MTLIAVVCPLERQVEIGVACGGPDCSIAISRWARLDSRRWPTRLAADIRFVGSRIEDHYEVGMGKHRCG
jgi:hypothetical protein